MRLIEDRQREIWFDGRFIPFADQNLWGLVNSGPLKKIVVSLDQRRNGHFPNKTQFITEIINETDLSELQTGETIISDNTVLLDQAKNHGLRTCAYFFIDNNAILEKACHDSTKYDYAIVDFDLPTNIPLELFIARLQKRNTVLLRRVATVADMEIAFGVMEEGSDGVLFYGTDPQEIQLLGNYLLRADYRKIELCPLVVTESRHIGMGVRACIDTTGLMTQEEGMLVGSTSSGGILVCSETHYLPYMNLRPFRVNAGAIHSYVWMPGDNAEYISDLQVGSKVLCVNFRGETRELSIGRIKMEVRPLLLIRGDAAGCNLNVVVQDDWHIRLMTADGQPINSASIRPGDQLLAYLCQPGRHMGIKIDETIIEK
jgi:3-dehydroquinate synthase II/3-amino-4-hydroxybenzoic acid synthase